MNNIRLTLLSVAILVLFASCGGSEGTSSAPWLVGKTFSGVGRLDGNSKEAHWVLVFDGNSSVGYDGRVTATAYDQWGNVLSGQEQQLGSWQSNSLTSVISITWRGYSVAQKWTYVQSATPDAWPFYSPNRNLVAPEKDGKFAGITFTSGTFFQAPGFDDSGREPEKPGKPDVPDTPENPEAPSNRADWFAGRVFTAQGVKSGDNATYYWLLAFDGFGGAGYDGYFTLTPCNADGSQATAEAYSGKWQADMTQGRIYIVWNGYSGNQMWTFSEDPDQEQWPAWNPNRIISVPPSASSLFAGFKFYSGNIFDKP